jgi:hypothetical protein
MNRMFSRRLTGAVGTVTVLASIGGLATILVISGGSGLTLVRAATPLGARRPLPVPPRPGPERHRLHRRRGRRRSWTA